LPVSLFRGIPVLLSSFLSVLISALLGCEYWQVRTGWGILCGALAKLQDGCTSGIPAARTGCLLDPSLDPGPVYWTTISRARIRYRCHRPKRGLPRVHPPALHAQKSTNFHSANETMPHGS
jgi:hypothetical protein